VDALRDTHSGGRVSKRDFKSHLGRLVDPPARLQDVTVVLVGTKKPGNVGAVARACGSFECEDLRIVAPRCDPHTRASLTAAKGAQHIVHGAGIYESLEDALLDVDTAVAFHVWGEGLEPEAVGDLETLLEKFPGGGGSWTRAPGETEDPATRPPTETDPFRDPDTENPTADVTPGSRRRKIRGFGETRETETVRPVPEALSSLETLAGGERGVEEDDPGRTVQNSGGWRAREHETKPARRSHRGQGKLALVFGREVEGLTDSEVNACDAMCAVPTGRLVESLSVSHAAVIILSRYFQNRTVLD
jgi:tRNA C32,U32 (ribose-2'-O)-methylase TrmJ